MRAPRGGTATRVPLPRACASERATRCSVSGPPSLVTGPNAARKRTQLPGMVQSLVNARRKFDSERRAAAAELSSLETKWRPSNAWSPEEASRSTASNEQVVLRARPCSIRGLLSSNELGRPSSSATRPWSMRRSSKASRPPKVEHPASERPEHGPRGREFAELV